jgi:hypothetical protein
METMLLVAGLAVAGLVGIAAAFYFSIRSGRGGRRLRPGRAGHAGTGRRPGSRSRGTARPDRLEEDARRPANGGRANAGRAADDSSRDYHSTDKPRRRVGFRKGADVDEELWPAEAFGGVSDEQFWDNLASDKPLATTARTAQQDPGPRNRLLDAAPPAGTQAVRAMGEDRPREGGTRQDRTRENRTREEGAHGEGSRGTDSGAYAESRTGPDPATERTMIQPSYAATQPVRSMTPQVPGATQPTAITQPTETRGRRRASSTDDEDPLTSAAFSLRPSGPVDGRSSRRSRDVTREQYGEPRPGDSRSGGPGPGSGSAHGATSPYAYAAGISYGDPSSVTPAMDSTPPYGENYGHGAGSPAAQAEDPRRPGGTGSHARHGGNGEGIRPARRAYPQGDYQGTGSYPVGGYTTGGNQGNGNRGADHQSGGYQGNGYPVGSYQTGSYPGNGRQGSSHRAPYDPRKDYRRLTHPR